MNAQVLTWISKPVGASHLSKPFVAVCTQSTNGYNWNPMKKFRLCLWEDIQSEAEWTAVGISKVGQVKLADLRKLLGVFVSGLISKRTNFRFAGMHGMFPGEIFWLTPLDYTIATFHCPLRAYSIRGPVACTMGFLEMGEISNHSILSTMFDKFQHNCCFFF